VDQVDGEAAELNGGGGASSSSCTASQLGSAMDELMSTLRVEAINSIIKMPNQLIEIRKNPNYICQKQSSSSSLSSS
jgi:hypothetical protein